MTEFPEISTAPESAEGRYRTAFFTGHRALPHGECAKIVAEIKRCVSYLYSLGVRSFHAGGALGFDTLAATAVLDLRRYHPGMTLDLDLPYRNQDFGWREQNKKMYEFILERADSVKYAYDGEVTSKKKSSEYLLQRNRTMADGSAYCIAYYNGSERGGTAYTVKYAQKSGCEVINIAELPEEFAEEAIRLFPEDLSFMLF